MKANCGARTLTNLYNDNPTWLRNAHAKLDAAVADAYELADTIYPDEEILDRLLALNLERVDAKEQRHKDRRCRIG